MIVLAALLATTIAALLWAGLRPRDSRAPELSGTFRYTSALETTLEDPDDLSALELCANPDSPDGERARGLRRLARRLSPRELGPILIAVGRRCGSLTCAEIFRHARAHPEPNHLERSALVVISNSTSEMLRLVAIEALAEIGSARSLDLLHRLRDVTSSAALLPAALAALERIEERRRPKASDGALSLHEEAGALSEADDRRGAMVLSGDDGPLLEVDP